MGANWPKKHPLVTTCFCVTLLCLSACRSVASVPPAATLTITPTRLPPTATAVIAPTSTSTPLPTATPTTPPTPTVITPLATPPTPPTPTISGLIGPDNFPANVNPLTGAAVSDPAVLARRPLAIKVSNAPPSVRPQAGLGSADLLFEHYAEAGLTRFTAVFYSQDAEMVGSIRSGRLIDLEIPRMYDAAFAYSGSVGLLRLMFRDSDFFERIISPDFAHGGFFRVADPPKAFEHTLFTNTYTLRYLLAQREEERPPQFANNMLFRAEPLTPGEPATRLELQYWGTNATWVYSQGRYLRWTDGVPHLDANTNDQLGFQNIIVVAAHHQETDILEDRSNYSIQIQIWGEGPVSIFRDGQRFDGRWRREDSSHMLTFYDLDGHVLPLSPGPSFFHLVPLGFDRLYVQP